MNMEAPSEWYIIERWVLGLVLLMFGFFQLSLLSDYLQRTGGSGASIGLMYDVLALFIVLLMAIPCIRYGMVHWDSKAGKGIGFMGGALLGASTVTVIL